MASQVVQPKNYVGFDTITTQIENRLLKRGFELNVMLVGQSGLGKSTLVNTLFATHLVDSNGRKSTFEPVERTVEIKSTSQILNENNVNLKLNVIDTPGFGDQINNDKCWEPIMQYIKEQNSTYLRKELTAQRERYIPDTRVHCVLYFIQPNGKGLRNLDIQVLSKLTTVVNVIPVIAKADTLTTEERNKFKSILHAQFEKHDLNFFPYDHEDLSEEELTLNQDIRSLLPFAVIGSENEISTIDGQVIRGRRTRWGLINVEDVTQCEFVYLRDFLTRTHLHDLIETTSVVHYETYRSKQLIALKEKNGQRVSNATMQ